ncbi:MAG: putative Ig domain-containing protein [Phycisphaerae bacterium]
MACSVVALATAAAPGVQVTGYSEGTLFGRGWVAIGYDVKPELPSRSGEPWFSTLYNPPLVELLIEPPNLRPEGIAFRAGKLYVSGDWNETQNQIAVFSTDAWGGLTFDHALKEPLTTPPPTSTPNNQWWGAEGLTFNTGATGIGAGGSVLVSVDNQQNGVGSTFATVDTTTGALGGLSTVTFPEDIAYAPASQRFYVMARSPNTITAYDANMNPIGLSWALPTRTRGMCVVSEQFGRFLTGDLTLTGDIIVAVSTENPAAVPPVVNRLSVYRADGTPVGAEQDASFVDLSYDNGSGGGGAPGPHTFQGIAVDEVHQVMYIGDDSARAVYALKPVTTVVGTASGPIAGRTWSARGRDVKHELPSRAGEPWFATVGGGVTMSNPPALAPEGLAYRAGKLYVAGDWNETHNQIAIYNTDALGTLTFDHAIAMPVSNPAPSLPNNQLWGPEGLTFNSSVGGYGAGASTLVTVEEDQFTLGGSTRATLDLTTGLPGSFGVLSAVGIGATRPADIAYGPATNRFYVLANPDVLQWWNNVNPPTYGGTQFATLVRSRGLTVISAAFAQFLLSNPAITQECLLVVAKSDPVSVTAPHNRLAVYSLAGALLGQQDLVWTRDAYPGQPLQTFEAVAVDETNKIIFIGDEKANAVYSLTLPLPLSITTPSPLPSGSAGVAYAQTIAASGGTPPYAFAVAGGALPAGLSLQPDGNLIGSPSACGPFSFSVQVTDSALPPATVSAPFLLSIGFGGVAGDVNNDGAINGGDVQNFVGVLLGGGLPGERCRSDLTGEGQVTAADIVPLVALLVGH